MLYATLIFLAITILLYLAPKYVNQQLKTPNTFKAVILKISSVAISIAIAAYSYYKLKDLYTINILIALVLCIIADVVICYNFTAGTLIFAAGHVFYITLFIKTGIDIKAFLIFLIVVSAVFVVIVFYFKNYLLKFYNSSKKVAVMPYISYATMLIVLLSLSYAVTYINSSVVHCMLSIGATLFVMSDITLIINMLVKTNKTREIISISLYYIGQFIIACSALFNYILSAAK